MVIRTQLSNVAKLLTLARSGRRRIGCLGWKLALDTRHSDSNVRNSLLQDEHSKDDFCVQSFLLTCAHWHTLALFRQHCNMSLSPLVIRTLPEYSEYCSSIRDNTSTNENTSSGKCRNSSATNAQSSFVCNLALHPRVNLLALMRATALAIVCSNAASNAWAVFAHHRSPSCHLEGALPQKIRLRTHGFAGFKRVLFWR